MDNGYVTFAEHVQKMKDAEKNAPTKIAKVVTRLAREASENKFGSLIGLFDYQDRYFFQSQVISEDVFPFAIACFIARFVKENDADVADVFEEIHTEVIRNLAGAQE